MNEQTMGDGAQVIARHMADKAITRAVEALNAARAELNPYEFVVFAGALEAAGLQVREDVCRHNPRAGVRSAIIVDKIRKRMAEAMRPAILRKGGKHA